MHIHCIIHCDNALLRSDKGDLKQKKQYFLYNIWKKKTLLPQHIAINSNLDEFKSDAFKIALLAVLGSCQAGGDRHWNVTLVLQVQLHSNPSPSAVKLQRNNCHFCFTCSFIQWNFLKKKYKHHWVLRAYFLHSLLWHNTYTYFSVATGRSITCWTKTPFL